MKLLHHGLELDGVKLKPARVSWANEDQLRFVLREGRKRQIRRMCEKVGLTVTALKRVRSGGVPLGKCRSANGATFARTKVLIPTWKARAWGVRAGARWDQFHSPKNLAMALSVEASELLEHFQWLTEEQSRGLDANAQAAVRGRSPTFCSTSSASRTSSESTPFGPAQTRRTRSISGRQGAKGQA